MLLAVHFELAIKGYEGLKKFDGFQNENFLT